MLTYLIFITVSPFYSWVAVRFHNDKSSKSSSHGPYDDRQPVPPPVVGLNNYDPRRVLTPVVVLRDHKEPVPPPVGIQDDHDLVAAPVGFHDYGPALPSHDSLTVEQKLTAALERIKLLEARRTKLTLEKFGLARFSGSPSSIKLYTGFPNYNQFKEFFTNIESHAKAMISFSQTQRKKFKTLNDYSCNLPLIDRLFMYLHKIRVGSLDQDLADKFNVTVPNVSRNTILFTDFLYCLLGAQRLWPTKPQVMKSMPFEFLMVYPDVRVVVDCVRVQLQCPLGLAMNSERQQASRRGSAVNMKALIGMMPCGAISFISSLHSCSISDSHLTKVSGLLELLEPGDKVLVDKDFDIGMLLQQKGCDVMGPHTLEKKGEFTSRELENNQRIGNAKMHVKRTMKRVTEFHIFDSPLHPTLLGSASQMWTVCCLLCNFQGPITKDAPKTVNS